MYSGHFREANAKASRASRLKLASAKTRDDSWPSQIGQRRGCKVIVGMSEDGKRSCRVGFSLPDFQRFPRLS